MKRVLFVSIAFPPKNDPECLQAARYFKYMLKSGLRIEVVTSSVPTLYMPYDETLEQASLRKVRAIEIPIYETRLSNYVMRKVSPWGMNFPDTKLSFFYQWRRVVRQVDRRPDIIYSRSNPVSSAFMALKLHRHYDVPWIMHLSDPWVGSPSIHYTAKELAFNKKWERVCVKEAAAVSFTTEATLDFYRSRYPECSRKFFLSPNVFDPDEMHSTAPDLTGPLRIVYTGGLAGNRSPGFFLDACSEALGDEPDLAMSEIIFAGPIDRRNKQVISSSGLPFVRHVGSLPYGAARQLQRDAHILLTIDEPIADPAKAMFFPSKILDYFLANRKILALTSKGSTSSRILSASDATVIHYPDKDSLKNFILNAVRAFREKRAGFFTGENAPDQLNAQTNSMRLVSLIQSL